METEGPALSDGEVGDQPDQLPSETSIGRRTGMEETENVRRRGLTLYSSAFIFLLVIAHPVFASGEQEGPQLWEKLDARGTPSWWSEAKFGLFIHWGPYSVPAYAAEKEYAEWYWKALRDPERPDHEAVRFFHRASYGETYPYESFAECFTAQFFDPEEWVRLFKSSGARYVVVTSKHHDGFALWPSVEASRTWGRPWNAWDVGPKRDLLGDLSTEVRKAGLRFGIYFSLYEWFNPIYLQDPRRFVSEHMMPQFKDVVSRYHPSVIFADGEWEHASDVWRSAELLDWLFTESPCSSDVVVNDRWGSETRHQHGGYYTTEYGSGLADNSHPWEENRGMGYSYGYNRTENIGDYSSGRELVLMLVDIVGRGGNFLLNVGPTADGRIPVIMQQRLIEIGDWLKINGEAIYGTNSWVRHAQWSPGEIRDLDRGQYKSGYDILKLTIDPDPGMAVKEVFFTRKGDDLYAICPVLPRDSLCLKGLTLPDSTEVYMLGQHDPLVWMVVGSDISIQLPDIDISREGGKAAYVFRLKGCLGKKRP